MNSLKLMFISAIMFFVVSVGYCTEHYVIETTTSTANQTYEDYLQEGGGGVFYIYFSGNLTVSHSTFTNNMTVTSGGVIYNGGTLNLGDSVTFSSNSAINNGGVMESSYLGTTNISNNTAFHYNEAQNGGAVSLYGNTTIGNQIIFTSNLSTENGGAIYTRGTKLLDTFNGRYYTFLPTITVGDYTVFELNEASMGGGAICNYTKMNIGNNTIFKSNSAKDGGAIQNNAITTFVWSSYPNQYCLNEQGKMTIGNNTVFSFNSATENGGAIYNQTAPLKTGELTLGNNSVFTSNTAQNGGAIYNSGIIIIGNNTEFSSNSASNFGGAIFIANESMTIGDNVAFSSNSATYGGAINNSSNLTISNGAEFINNSAGSKGGAIYNSGTLNLTADTINVEFTGNTANGISNAINNGGIINLTAGTADIIFNDRITSENNTSILNINKSSNILLANGTVILNADMSGYLGNVNFENGKIQLGNNGTFFNGNLTVSNAEIDFANNVIQNYNFNNLTVSHKLNLIVDADLENETMDTISAESYNGAGKIAVNKINILSDAKTNNLDIIFTTSTVLKAKITTITTASSALCNYNVLYNTNTGSFNFTRSSVNPILLEGSVSAMAGGYVTQVNVLGQSFNSIDGFVNSNKISAKKHGNLYASTANQIFESTNKIERGLWLRPYAVQETVKLENTDVDNISYGTLAGLDLVVTENKMVSFYFGSTGSKQEYEEIKANQTGYIIGASGMLVKDNYYIALTANAGFTDVNADNDYGTDKFKIMMYSIGAKAGYDIEAGKNWIIQPNLLLMYGTIKTDEYITSQGAKVDSNSTNNIHIKPQIKAKLELKNGWTPYGLTGIVFNTGDKAKTITEGIDLESMSFNSYIEYGAGLDKKFIETSW
ncbi:MAG: autotransporter domain-containing protein, partial [Endomicrobiaceae bacterium]|nr:autotransporter domain-containing protein [Endomicrobiaceae bacterium]